MIVKLCTAVGVVALMAACSSSSSSGTGSSEGGGSGGNGGGLAGGAGGGGGGSAGGSAGGAGGGGGGSGVGGGSGGGAGGGASGTGLFSIIETGLKHPQLVATPDGTFHLAYSSGFTPSVIVYGQCKQNCRLPASWNRVIIESGAPITDYTRMVIGADNRIHIVFELFSNAVGTETIYATCAANCLNAGSWAKSNLSSVFGSSSVSWRGAPMVIDSSNRLSLVVTDGGTRLATCAGTCTSAANWSLGLIRATGNRTAMVALGTTLHAVMHNGVSALVYRTCASNCTQAASWTESPALFTHDASMPTAISISPQGRVSVAYNQGVAGAGESAAVKAQDDKVLVWECSSNCMAAASWTGVILGAVKDGAAGLSMVEAAGLRAIALTQTTNVIARACEVDCMKPESWPGIEVDNAAALNADFDPYSVTGCGPPAAFAAWYPSSAVVVIGANRAAAFAHYTTMLRRCPSTTTITSLPGFGRIAYVP